VQSLLGDDAKEESSVLFQLQCTHFKIALVDYILTILGLLGGAKEKEKFLEFGLVMLPIFLILES